MLRWAVLAVVSILLVACNQPSKDAANKAADAAAVASPNASHSAPRPAFTQFEDPVEHAFTIEVPQGWPVKGGMVRLGYFDVRPMVEMKSPDGKIFVRLNDYGIPPYSVPDRAHPKEGVSYTLEARAQITVAQFRSGPEFALRYAESRFKDVCGKMEVAPNSAPLKIKFNPPPPEETPEESEGQVIYRCADGSQAFVYAKTSLVRTSAPQLWTVAGLISYHAPANEAAGAAAVATHSAESFRFTSKWLEDRKEMERKGLEYTQASAKGKKPKLSDEAKGFKRAIGGVTATRDPLADPERQAWTGQSGQYWVNGLGQVVNSKASPGSSFHPLQVIR